MSYEEFYTEITGYYGSFPNTTVSKRFMQTLKRIRESDLDKLLDWFFANIPARLQVDNTTLLKGVSSCCIFFIEPKKRCPICQKLVNEKAQICCNCNYDFAVPPERYKKTLVTHEMVIASMKKAVEDAEERRAKAVEQGKPVIPLDYSMLGHELERRKTEKNAQNRGWVK